VCGSQALSLLGSKDFAYSCNDHFEGRSLFPAQGVGIDYHRCATCGFTFTAAFDEWSAADFKAHIYNADYVLADPVFPVVRPTRNSQMVAALWNRALATTEVLDYGGGDGSFARHLREMGHRCHSFDAFHGGEPPPSDARYEIVTCFEVIEHVPHLELNDWFAGLVGHVAPRGTLLLSTELIDADPSLGNWYIAPRNGHISLHTTVSLNTLATQHDVGIFSINHEMHLLRHL
jgi:hypothetical protein